MLDQFYGHPQVIRTRKMKIMIVNFILGYRGKSLIFT